MNKSIRPASNEVEVSMSQIDRFEKLIAWQKARNLTKQIYEIIRKEQFARDYGLASQIQRAAVSVMSNIAEGFDRGGRSEVHQFLSMAKASCAEVRTQLYIALDVKYIEKEEFDRLITAVVVGKIVGGLRAAVQRQKAGHSSAQSSALSPQS
jgi:four helix bundle protein